MDPNTFKGETAGRALSFTPQTS